MTVIQTSGRPECRNGGRCHNHRCNCPVGFTGFICQLDVNECRGDYGCSHYCFNSYGSYRCACPRGFALRADGKTCTKDNRTER
ncbi:hypothetical protein V1264_017818 [Littorina saxatilis]|uniref:EGF-like domain-containing protein n=1 Tax=Littorina saxatilis TaxID=31220 RepID=A0AAN9BKD2_9CAEN